MNDGAVNELILLPCPRFIDFSGGAFAMPERGLFVFEGMEDVDYQVNTGMLFTVLRTVGLQDIQETNWQLGRLSDSGTKPSIRVRRIPDAEMHGQGYEISITPDGIEVLAATPAGIFYGVQTLMQIIRQTSPWLPCLHIRDWPDFPNRGVMLDISRDKVPSMDTLFSLVDLLASWKISQFQLYTEHTFAYQNHSVVWANASPITAEEIQALDFYCRSRYVELVPNQNSFGHMRRWLVHKEYNHLAECPQGCDTAWGHFDEPFTLAPTEPGTLDFVRGLYEELLPNFSSRQFNVGCDETVDLGQGKSRELVAQRGAGRVYLDFLLQVHELVSANDRTMQFWGDIVREYPDLVDELPRDVVALEWGYEANHSFDKNSALFAQSEIPFYVCPGTSSWNSVAGRTDNAMANLLNAAENGLKHGALGYLITDWGDNGHWQPLPVSYLGYAYGAAVSWAVESNRDIDIKEALNKFAFFELTGAAGQVAYDLGNVYESTLVQLPNRTLLFQVLQTEADQISSLVCPDGECERAIRQFRTTLAIIDGISSDLPLSRMRRPDAVLVQREFSWVADMLRHACWRAIWSLQKSQARQGVALRNKLSADGELLIAGHDQIWHARNRPGGFADSQARLQKMVDEYSD